MADDLHYVPGDFYRLDDRSGFKVRARRMRKEWTELIVDRDLFELRPAQDFVKGVVDDQTVPEPRPRPSVDPMVGPLQATLVAPSSLMGGLLLEGGAPLLLEHSGSLSLEQLIPFDENPFNIDAVFVYPPGYANPLSVSSTMGMVINDTIQIMLDNGELFRTTISSIPVAGQINIAHLLPFRASAGNIVLDLTQANIVKPDNEDFLT